MVPMLCFNIRMGGGIYASTLHLALRSFLAIENCQILEFSLTRVFAMKALHVLPSSMTRHACVSIESHTVV